MNRHQMSFLDTFDAQLLNVLQGLKVLSNLAGYIATAIHVAFVQYIQECLIDLDLTPQQRIGHVEFAAGRVGMPVISRCRWTPLDKIKIFNVSPGYVFTI